MNAPGSPAILKNVLFLFLSLYTLPTLAASVSGLPQSKPLGNFKYKDSWNFYLSPYIWFAGPSGHVNIQNHRAALSTRLSQFRHDLDFSFGGRFEANRDPWSLLLDSAYLKITQDPVYLGINSKISYQTTISDLGAYYQLYTKTLAQQPEPCTTGELFGGARIATWHTVIAFLNNAPSASVSDTSSVVVPILGGRVKYLLSPTLKLGLTADYGGFQVSHVSGTWSAALGLNYALSPNFGLNLAYKALGIKYSIQAVTINTLVQGPVLGCTFSW